jgi:hypothetical protein
VNPLGVLPLALLLGFRGSTRSQDAADAGSAPTSLFARPLYLTESEPDCRASRVIQLAHLESTGSARSTRSRSEALSLAAGVRDRLMGGGGWSSISAAISDAPGRSGGGVLGSFPRGALDPSLEAFLWNAEEGEVSPPLDLATGVLVVQRIARFVACEELVVLGTDDAARAIADEIFALADRRPTLQETALEMEAAGRAFTHAREILVLERGPDDALQKRALFDAVLGEIVGPFRSGRGFHVSRRIELSAAAPDAFATRWIRARAVFIGHRDSPGPVAHHSRTSEEAAALAREIHRRALAGEDLAVLAREFDDDPGGRARSGDLGWIYRGHPGLARGLEAAFLAKAGELLDPIAVASGWLIVRRER